MYLGEDCIVMDHDQYSEEIELSFIFCTTLDF